MAAAAARTGKACGAALFPQKGCRVVRVTVEKGWWKRGMVSLGGRAFVSATVVKAEEDESVGEDRTADALR